MRAFDWIAGVATVLVVLEKLICQGQRSKSPDEGGSLPQAAGGVCVSESQRTLLRSAELTNCANNEERGRSDRNLSELVKNSFKVRWHGPSGGCLCGYRDAVPLTVIFDGTAGTSGDEHEHNYQTFAGIFPIARQLQSMAGGRRYAELVLGAS